MDRDCKVCKEKLHGRADQKFCSDHCRSYYHNSQMKNRRKQWRSVHTVIRKNREILQRLLQINKERLPFELLIRSGFHPNYMTFLDRSGDKDPIYWCYDHGYRLNKDNPVTIVNEKTWKSFKMGD